VGRRSSLWRLNGLFHQPPLRVNTLSNDKRFSERRSLRGLTVKAYTEYLWFNTKKPREFINITEEVEKALEKSQIREGLILVSAMHITAGVYVNDAESGLIAGVEEWLEKLAPFRRDYRHHRTGESNGDAHLKNLLIGHEAVVPVTNGGLAQTPFCGVCDLPKGLTLPFQSISGKNLLSGSMPFYKRIYRVAPQFAVAALYERRKLLRMLGRRS
jgi:secondary thiamine-phosphate synthase enzyme